MELKQIEAFLKIVEKGSFSAAAEELFVSQPTVSVRIQQLEKELEKPLFERLDGRKIILSKYGETVLPYFEEAMELIQKGRSLIHEQPMLQEKIVISCPNHMGVEILPELLKELYFHFPQTEFDVRINMTKKILEDIREGNVHIGFGYLREQDIQPDLNMVQIVKEKTIFVCAPDHPLADQEVVSISELKKERVIIYDRDFLTTKRIEGFLQKNGLNDYKKIEINNLGWIKMMVRKGLGIAFLQKIIVKEELQNGQLIEKSLSKSPPLIPIYLIFSSQLDNEIREISLKATRSIFSRF